MKTSKILPAGRLAIGLATGTGVARADSTDATGMLLRWNNGKHIRVTWGGNSHAGSPYNSFGYSRSGSSEYQRGYTDGMRGNWADGSVEQVESAGAVPAATTTTVMPMGDTANNCSANFEGKCTQPCEDGCQAARLRATQHHSR